MPAERVVNNGQQISKKRGPLAEFAHQFTNPTIRSYGPDRPSNYKAAKEIPGSSDVDSSTHLDRASALLTKQGAFTESDLHRFTDAMLKVTGSYKIAEGVNVSAVPDRIPKTGVKGISIHQEVAHDGVSVNIVYEMAKDEPDVRYVVGDNFGQGTFNSRRTALNVGRAENPIQEIPGNKTVTSEIRLDGNAPDNVDTDALRKEVCEDIYVAYLADAERIDRSRQAAETVREKLHQGTPVTELQPTK